MQGHAVFALKGYLHEVGCSAKQYNLKKIPKDKGFT